MNLSPYEWILDFYRQLQEAYGWTITEIDDSDMEIILEQVRIFNEIENAPEYTTIENALPL